MFKKREPEKLRKLFINGLDYMSREDSLKSHFEQWGKIVDCVVMKEPYTRKSRGYGFITYQHAHMVDGAQAARPHKIDGREVETKRAIPREDSHKPESRVTVNKLYISVINDDLSEEYLREYFRPYGHIVSINVLTNTNTGMKSFATVKFDDYDPVDKIILQRHNYKGKYLKVEKFISREEKHIIDRKVEMGVFGRRGGCTGDRGKWLTTDEFDRGDRGGGYRGGYGYSGYRGGYKNGGGGWNDGYAVTYPIGGGGGNFGSSYDGGPVQGNTGYAHRSLGTYGGGPSDGFNSQVHFR